jgi:hypothetical protein
MRDDPAAVEAEALEAIEAEAQEAQAEPEAPEPQPEVKPEREAEARKYGWRPKSEWRGDDGGWVDADRFLELPSTHVKQLREESKRDKADFEQRIARAEQAAQAAMQRQQDRHKRDMQEILQRQRKAAEDGDMQAYDALEKQRADMQKPEPQAPQEDPYLTQYRKDNPWINNPILGEAAFKAVQMRPDIQRLDVKDQIEFAENAVREAYPHAFEAPKPAPAGAAKVDGGGLAGGVKKSLADKLPAEAKRFADQYVEQGLYKNREEYAKVYFEGERA